VAILPLPTVRREVEAGLLRAIPFSDVQWVRPLGIIHRRQKSLPTAVQKFIELLTGKGSATAPSAGALIAEGSATTTSPHIVIEDDGSGSKRIAKPV
jgi:hypothetical protein